MKQKDIVLYIFVVQSFLSKFFVPCVFVLAFMASIASVLHSRIHTPLIDYAYQIEQSYRIVQGEMPYRDFFLVLTPGTYLLTALSMAALGGYTHLGHMGFVILDTFFIVASLAWLLRILGIPKIFSLIILTLTIVTGHSTYYPISYDMLASTASILSVIVFFCVLKKSSPLWCILPGFLFGLPFFFKQSMGIFFLGGLFVVCASALVRWYSPRHIKQMVYVLLGIFLFFGVFFGWLLIEGAFTQFFYQAFTFPAAQRSMAVSVKKILDNGVMYIQLVFPVIPFIVLFFVPLLVKKMAELKNIRVPKIYTMVWVHTIGALFFILCAVFTVYPQKALYTDAPFVLFWITVYGVVLIHLIYQLFSAKRFDSLLRGLIPFVFVCTAFGSHISSDIPFSSYGIWPLVLICFAVSIQTLKKLVPSVPWYSYVACIVVYFFVLLARWNGLVPVKPQFPHQFHLNNLPLSDTTTVASGRAMGLTTQGAYAHQFETMFAFVEQYIPKNDIVAFFPGEDPFFAATGRKNPLPFQQLFVDTYPVGEINLLAELRNSHVRWIVVKRDLIAGVFEDVLNPYWQLSEDYELERYIPGYVILRKK